MGLEVHEVESIDVKDVAMRFCKLYSQADHHFEDVIEVVNGLNSAGTARCVIH